METPKPLPNPDFSILQATVEGCLQHAKDNKYWDEDNDHYIFEQAMIAIYGKDFFTWRNQQKW